MKSDLLGSELVREISVERGRAAKVNVEHIDCHSPLNIDYGSKMVQVDQNVRTFTSILRDISGVTLNVFCEEGQFCQQVF